MKNTIEFKNFKYLTEKECELVYFQRNRPEIRQYMVNSESFSYSDHKRFLEKLKIDDSSLYYLVNFNDLSVAVFCYTDIIKSEHTYETGCYFFNEDPSIRYDITLSSVEVQLKHGLYYPKIRVKKNNKQALIFNIMKMDCQIISEDSEFYYLKRNTDLDPFDRVSMSKAKKMLESISEKYYIIIKD